MIDNKEYYFEYGTPNSKLEWFAVHTKPRQESTAKLHLERQGFEIYLPRIAQTKRIKGSLATVIKSYFPRYLFVRFDVKRDNWGCIRSTRGVCGLVKMMGKPQPIQDQFIDALKANENTEHLQRVAERRWNKGDEIEIECGPFHGYRCIFQENRGSNRVSVLLTLIGKPTLATLNRQDLQVPQYA